MLTALLVVRPAVIPTSAPAQAINPDFGKLPLSFVPNVGQTNPAVRFQVHDMSGMIFFTSGEAVLALPATASAATSVVHLRFEGANPTPMVAGVGRLPGIVNHFVGDNPAAWRTNIPTYAGILYRQLYPGIDLRYDGVNGQLKGTYVVAPGADPSLIRWHHDGATGVRLDEKTGDLLIGLADSTLIENAPIAWQEIEGQRIFVVASYVLAEDGSVGFAVGEYDRTQPLTIDPTLIYSTYLGGSGFEEAADIAVDGEGNIYVVGTTSSADFPTEGGYD
ncbi:MAG: SBBP repeat-containing protein, partial [Chloroflexota bacterium]|nr:SBBP repeat-containing protein [Chloroflexota bacterium]